MKIGMTLALVSGILTLLVGVIGVLIVGTIGAGAGALGASGAAAKTGLFVIVLLGLPIMAIVGGAMAHSNPKAAIWLTGLPGVIIAGVGTFSMEFNALILFLGATMVVSAAFIYRASESAVNQASERD